MDKRRKENVDDITLKRCDFTTDELTTGWEVACLKQHEWYDETGKAKWAATRGPIGSAVLSIERIRGRTTSGVEWVDDLGVVRQIGDYSPKLFGRLMKASYKRASERSLAIKVGATELEGKRACLDGARAYLAAAKHTEAEKKVVAAAVTNAVWTSDRLDAAGYEVPDMLCQKCLLYNDTLHHRMSTCTHGDVV